MPGIAFLALVLMVALAAGCSKNANNSNGGNSTNTASGNKSAAAPTGGSTTTGSPSTPTEVLRAYYAAANRKDTETAKKYLSQGTMRLMEEGAKKMGKSVDEAMKEGVVEGAPINPDLSNEKITGDTASVDIKAEGRTITMPMVKEGGEWKLAMDKLLENLNTEMGGTAPKGPASPDADNDEDDHNGGH